MTLFLKKFFNWKNASHLKKRQEEAVNKRNLKKPTKKPFNQQSHVTLHKPLPLQNVPKSPGTVVAHRDTKQNPIRKSFKQFNDIDRRNKYSLSTTKTSHTQKKTIEETTLGKTFLVTRPGESYEKVHLCKRFIERKNVCEINVPCPKRCASVSSLSCLMTKNASSETSINVVSEQTCYLKHMTISERTESLIASRKDVHNSQKYIRRPEIHYEKVPAVLNCLSPYSGIPQNTYKKGEASKRQYHFREKAFPNYDHRYKGTHTCCTLDSESDSESMSNKIMQNVPCSLITMKSAKRSGIKQKSLVRNYFEGSSQTSNVNNITTSSCNSTEMASFSSILELPEARCEQSTAVFQVDTTLPDRHVNANVGRIQIAHDSCSRDKEVLDEQLSHLMCHQAEIDKVHSNVRQDKDSFGMWSSEEEGFRYSDSTAQLETTHPIKNMITNVSTRLLHDEQDQPQFTYSETETRKRLKSEYINDYNSHVGMCEQSKVIYSNSNPKKSLPLEIYNPRTNNESLSYTRRNQERIHMVESLLSVNTANLNISDSIEVHWTPSTGNRTVTPSHSGREIMSSQISTIVCSSAANADHFTQSQDQRVLRNMIDKLTMEFAGNNISPLTKKTEIPDKKNRLAHIIEETLPSGWSRVSNTLTFVPETCREINQLQATTYTDMVNGSSGEALALSENKNPSTNLLMFFKTAMDTNCEQRDLFLPAHGHNNITPQTDKSKIRPFPSLLEFLDNLENDNPKLNERIRLKRLIDRSARKKCTRTAKKQDDNLPETKQVLGSEDSGEDTIHRKEEVSSISLSQTEKQNHVPEIGEVSRIAPDSDRTSIDMESWKPEIMSFTDNDNVNIKNIPTAFAHLKRGLPTKKTTEVKIERVLTDYNLIDHSKINSSKIATGTENVKSKPDYSTFRQNNTSKISDKATRGQLKHNNKHIQLGHVPEKRSSLTRHHYGICHNFMQNPAGSIKSYISHKHVPISDRPTKALKLAKGAQSTLSDGLWPEMVQDKRQSFIKHLLNVSGKDNHTAAKIVDRPKQSWKSRVATKTETPYYITDKHGYCSDDSHNLTNTNDRDCGQIECSEKYIVRLVSDNLAPFPSAESANYKVVRSNNRECLQAEDNSVTSRTHSDTSKVVPQTTMKVRSRLPVRTPLQRVVKTYHKVEKSISAKTVTPTTDAEVFSHSNSLSADLGTARSILPKTPKNEDSIDPDLSLFKPSNKTQSLPQKVNVSLKKQIRKQYLLKQNNLGKVTFHTLDKHLDVNEPKNMNSKEMSTNYLVHTVDHPQRQKNTDSDKHIVETQNAGDILHSSSSDHVLSIRSAVSIHSLDRIDGLKQQSPSYTSKYRSNDNRSLQYSWRGTIAFRKRLQHLLQNNKKPEKDEKSLCKRLLISKGRSLCSHKSVELLISEKETVKARLLTRPVKLKDYKNDKDGSNRGNTSKREGKKDRETLARLRKDVQCSCLKNTDDDEYKIVPVSKLDVSDKCEEAIGNVSSIRNSSQTDLFQPFRLSDSTMTKESTQSDCRSLAGVSSEAFATVEDLDPHRIKPHQKFENLIQKGLFPQVELEALTVFDKELYNHSQASTPEKCQSHDTMLFAGLQRSHCQRKKQLESVLNSWLKRERPDSARTSNHEILVLPDNVETISCRNENLYKPIREQTIPKNEESTSHRSDTLSSSKWMPVICEDENVLDIHADARNCDFFVGEKDLIYAADSFKIRGSTRDHTCTSVAFPNPELDTLEFQEEIKQNVISGQIIQTTQRQDAHTEKQLPSFAYVEHTPKHVTFTKHPKKLKSTPQQSDICSTGSTVSRTDGSSKDTQLAALDCNMKNAMVGTYLTPVDILHKDSVIEKLVTISPTSSPNKYRKSGTASDGAGNTKGNLEADQIYTHRAEEPVQVESCMRTPIIHSDKSAIVSSANVTSENLVGASDGKLVSIKPIMASKDNDNAENEKVVELKTSNIEIRSEMSPSMNQIIAELNDKRSTAEESLQIAGVSLKISKENSINQLNDRALKTISDVDVQGTSSKYLTELYQNSQLIHITSDNAFKQANADVGPRQQQFSDAIMHVCQNFESQQMAPSSAAATCRTSLPRHVTMENIRPSGLIELQTSWAAEQTFSSKSTVNRPVEFLHKTDRVSIHQVQNTHANVPSASCRQVYAVGDGTYNTALVGSQIEHSLQNDLTKDHLEANVGRNIFSDSCNTLLDEVDNHTEIRCYETERKKQHSRLGNARSPAVDDEIKHFHEILLGKIRSPLVPVSERNNKFRINKIESKFDSSYLAAESTCILQSNDPCATNVIAGVKDDDTLKRKPQKYAKISTQTQIICKGFQRVAKDAPSREMYSNEEHVLEKTRELICKHRSGDARLPKASPTALPTSKFLQKASTSQYKTAKSQVNTIVPQNITARNRLQTQAVIFGAKKYSGNIDFKMVVDINSPIPDEVRSSTFKINSPNQVSTAQMCSAQRSAVESKVSDTPGNIENGRQPSFANEDLDQQKQPTRLVFSRTSSITGADERQSAESQNESPVPETKPRARPSKRTFTKVCRTVQPAEGSSSSEYEICGSHKSGREARNKSSELVNTRSYTTSELTSARKYKIIESTVSIKSETRSPVIDRTFTEYKSSRNLTGLGWNKQMTDVSSNLSKLSIDERHICQTKETASPKCEKQIRKLKSATKDKGKDLEKSEIKMKVPFEFIKYRNSSPLVIRNCDIAESKETDSVFDAIVLTSPSADVSELDNARNNAANTGISGTQNKHTHDTFGLQQPRTTKETQLFKIDNARRFVETKNEKQVENKNEDCKMAGNDEQADVGIRKQEHNVKIGRYLTKKQTGKESHQEIDTNNINALTQTDDLESLLNKELSKVTVSSGCKRRCNIMQHQEEKTNRKRRKSRKLSSPLSCHLERQYQFLRENGGLLNDTSSNTSQLATACPNDAAMYRPKKPRKLIMPAKFSKLEEFIQKAEEASKSHTISIAPSLDAKLSSLTLNTLCIQDRALLSETIDSPRIHEIDHPKRKSNNIGNRRQFTRKAVSEAIFPQTSPSLSTAKHITSVKKKFDDSDDVAENVRQRNDNQPVYTSSRLLDGTPPQLQYCQNDFMKATIERKLKPLDSTNSRPADDKNELPKSSAHGSCINGSESFASGSRISGKHSTYIKADTSYMTYEKPGHNQLSPFKHPRADNTFYSLSNSSSSIVLSWFGSDVVDPEITITNTPVEYQLDKQSRNCTRDNTPRSATFSSLKVRRNTR